MRKLFLITMIVLLVMGVSINTMAADFVLNLGHGAPQDNPRHIIAEEFAEYVEQETDGRVEINIHPSETIGNDNEMAEQVAMGALDLSINSQGPVASFNDSLNIIGMPFLFETPEQAYAVLDDEQFISGINEGLLNEGIRVLSFWENGFRHITNSVRPIYEPEDLDGISIRTPEDRVTLAIFRTLGASPAPHAFGELYMALQQGVFDAQENPVTNIYYANLHEVQDYLSLTNHKYETCPLIVSEIVWETLPEDVKEVIQEGAEIYAQEHREMNLEQQDELLDIIREEESMEINEANIPALQEATQEVYDEFVPEFGEDLMNHVNEIIDSVE